MSEREEIHMLRDQLQLLTVERDKALIKLKLVSNALHTMIKAAGWCPVCEKFPHKQDCPIK